MYTHEKIITDRDFPIRLKCFYYEEKHIMNKHWHRSLEIIMPTHGTLKIWVNGHEHIVKSGQAFIVNSCEVHQIEWLEDTSFYQGYCLQINYSYMQLCSPKLKDIYFRQPQDKQLHSMMKKGLETIAMAYEHADDYAILYIESQVIALLYVLCKNLGQAMPNDHLYKRVATIADYMEKNYDENITIEQVAKHFSVSPRYLSFMFKTTFGISPKEYLTQYRLRKAKQALVSSNAPIIDIALANGFSNLNSFFKTFKKYFDKTPAQYRKEKNS